jgi:threonine dehydrogenase-like Zn-dependent dehydrogenase
MVRQRASSSQALTKNDGLKEALIYALDLSETDVHHQGHQPAYRDRIVLGSHNVCFAGRAAMILNEVHGQIVDLPVVVKLPDLDRQVARLPIDMYSIGLHLDTGTLHLLIVADGDETAASGTRTRIELLEGTQQVGITKQMGHGVITGDHQVKLLAVAQGRHMIRKLGTFVAFSVLREPVTVDWTIIGDTKELNIHGAHLSPHCYPVAIDMLRKGLLPMDRIVTHRLPLERFHEGIELVGAGDRSIKVTLTP